MEQSQKMMPVARVDRVVSTWHGDCAVMLLSLTLFGEHPVSRDFRVPAGFFQKA